MSELPAARIPKPSDEQAFERCNEILWRCILKDPGVQLLGRRGQRQHGVDIVGCRDKVPDQIVGIQCKLIGEGKSLKEDEVRAELRKALTFKPLLSEFIIVTTAPDDTALHALALRLSDSASKSREKELRVSVLGWGSLEREIRRYPEALKAFDPSHTPQADLLEQKLDGLPDKVTGGIRPQLDAILAAVTATHPIDSATHGAEVQSEQERQIDAYADLISTDPEAALDLFQKLLATLGDGTPGRILFRVTANIASCQLELGNEETAAQGFIAAWDFDPDNPKAAANKAFGLLLKQDWPGLRAFAEPLLLEQQDNAALAACHVHGLIFDETVADPLTLVPEAVRGTSQLAEAHVRWQMARGGHGAWRDVAIAAHQAHPDNDALAEMCASALLDRVLDGGRSVHGRQLSSANVADIQGAIEIYETRWKQIRDRGRHARADSTSVPLNLMDAHRLLGRSDKAMEIGTEALSRFPADATVKEYLAATLVEHGEFARALDLVSGSGITPKTVAVHYNAAIAKEDWHTISDLACNHLEQFPEAERKLVQASGIVARVELAPAEERRSILEEQVDAFEGDARALTRLAQSAREQGFEDLSSDRFEAALTALENGDDGLASRYFVAGESLARRDPGTAAEVLFGHVPLDRDSRELHLLANALVNDYPIRERAVRFFNDLAPEIRGLPSLQQLEGALHVSRGVPQAAIAPLSAAFEQQPTVDSFMHLADGHFRIGNREAIAALLQRKEIDTMPGSAASRIKLSQLLLEFGEGSRAIDAGYQALVDGLEDATVVMRFFGLVLTFTQTGAECELDAVVAPGVWVRLTQDQGESYEAIVNEPADRPWGAKVDSCNAFIAKALGQRVGDTFERINAATGATETWTIAEVKPRWLQAFHHLSVNFSQRFPDASGFASVSMAEGDVQPALDLVRRQSEEARDRADLYLVKNLPIAFIAGDAPGGTIAFGGYLASIGHDLRVCCGTEAERAEALGLIQDNACAGAVLDAFTAWHAALLDVLSVLRERLGPLSIPAPELHRLLAMIDHHAALGSGEETMHLGYHDGQFTRDVVTPEDRAEQLALMRSKVEQIQKACETEPLVIPDDLSEFGEQLLRFPSPDAFAPAIIAGRSRLLLCEDMMMRHLSAKAYGTKGVWLQAVLLSAVQAEKIEFDSYVHALVHLAAHRHGHVAIDAPALLSAFGNDPSDGLVQLQALCTYIGNQNAELSSHVGAAANFINTIWSDNSRGDSRVRKASELLIEALLHPRTGDEWPSWATVLYLRLDDAPRTFLLDWCRERNLPVDELRAVAGHTDDAAHDNQ